jgi:hypothetical protein
MGDAVGTITDHHHTAGDRGLTPAAPAPRLLGAGYVDKPP